MLRVVQSAGAAAAKSYYTEGLSREDYYSEGQERVGLWGGIGAQRLGLHGDVGREAFNSLCDNINPATGERLTARNSDGRRVGYDFNFHVPKSVSAVYALTGDEAILSAFRASVRETMQDIEADMHTRVRKGGKWEDRQTGNLAYAEFVHFTARPVDGVPDPHLHAHCFVFNATYDEAEARWKAGEFSHVKRDAGYYEAAFHARLAGKVAGLGYGIERTKKGWELSGVPGSIIDKFSRRTAEIETAAEAKGITSAKAKDQLGARTRAGKRKGVTMDALRAEWSGRLTDTERNAIHSACGRGAAVPETSDKAAMDYALAHAFERQSVVTDRELQAQALRHGVGSVTVDGVKREAERAEIFRQNIDGRTLATTRGVLAEEKAMIDYVRQGRGRQRALGSKQFQFETAQLNSDQRGAVLHVLRSRDRVIGIRGGAGTGKTTLLKEAVRGIEEGGHKVYTFAPTADASRGVLRSEGFADAETVAKLLSDKATQNKIAGQVIWIDEAGLMGARQMSRVFAIADAQNARVILSGDIRQHASVERGDALRLLEDRAKLSTAYVGSIQRQKGTYKQAVEAISKGDIHGGFDRLEGLGAVVEMPDATRYQTLAGEYVQSVKAGKSALVVSPTHAEGQKVTDAIRADLRRNAMLEEKERSFLRLENLQLTEAERGDARHYQPGQVVQFVMNAQGGFSVGERLRVADVAGNRVNVTDEAGRVRALPMEQAARFQVYQEGKIDLAKGDTLRITQNGFCIPKEGQKKGHRLNNGAMYGVAGFTRQGDIKLNNGWVVRKDYGNIAYGYAATSHGSQGKTVDRVFIAQSAASARASSREQFYVSVSRGRESVKIYTDDKQALKEAVTESTSRMSATELAEQGKRQGFGQKISQHAQTLGRLAEQAKIHAQRAVEAARQQAKTWEKKTDQQKQPTQKGMDYER